MFTIKVNASLFVFNLRPQQREQQQKTRWRSWICIWEHVHACVYACVYVRHSRQEKSQLSAAGEWRYAVQCYRSLCHESSMSSKKYICKNKVWPSIDLLQSTIIRFQVWFFKYVLERSIYNQFIDCNSTIILLAVQHRFAFLFFQFFKISPNLLI